MLVRECMSRRLETIDADATVAAAAERMRACNIGSLAVVHAGFVVGIVTDRDLVVRVLAKGGSATMTVRVAMTSGITTCLADDDVENAARTMARAGVRRLVVLDRELEPVGLLSLDDLALHACAPDLLATVLGHPV